MYNVFVKLFSLFFCMFVGYGSYKKGIITESVNVSLSNLLIRVILPCNIILSMQREFTKDRFAYSILVLILSVVIHFAAMGIGYFFVKNPKIPVSQKGVLMFSLTFTNVAFIGFPVLDAMYGQEAIFYGSLVTSVFNVLVYTIGYKILSIGYDTPYAKSFSWKKIIKNNVIIAVVVGFLLFVFQLKLPAFVGESLGLVGGMTSPLALLIVGAILAKSDIRTVFKDKNMFFVSFIRLMVIPVALYFILSPFISDPLILNTLVIIFGMPVATTTAIMAEEIGTNSEYASQSIFFTTLCCAITLPLLFYFIPH